MARCPEVRCVIVWVNLVMTFGETKMPAVDDVTAAIAANLSKSDELRTSIEVSKAQVARLSATLGSAGADHRPADAEEVRRILIQAQELESSVKQKLEAAKTAAQALMS